MTDQYPIGADTALALMEAGVDPKTRRWAEKDQCLGTVIDSRPEGWAERRAQRHATFDVAASAAAPEKTADDMAADLLKAVVDQHGEVRRNTSLIAKDGQFRPGFQEAAEAAGFDGTNHLEVAKKLVETEPSFRRAVSDQVLRDAKNKGAQQR